MNLAKFAIEKKVITIVLTLVMLGGGMLSFTRLGMLEDPEFTIKDALVITPYQGASAKEVEEEVTDRLELAVQQMGQLKRVTSRSVPGMSTLTVTMQNNYDKSSLPQVWDELRRKINDAQSSLPPGAGPSVVVDDYGDVYGVFLAITGDEYSYAELKEYVKMLRLELLLVQDVAKIDTFGMRDEAVYIEPDRDRMAQLGVPLPPFSRRSRPRTWWPMPERYGSAQNLSPLWPRAPLHRSSNLRSCSFPSRGLTNSFI